MHPRLWRALFAADAELASDAEAEAFSQVLRRGDAVLDVEAWVWKASFRIAAGLMAGRADRWARTDAGTVEPLVIDDAGELGEFLGLLGGLTDQQRAVVVLRYVGDLRPAEIAVSLSTTAATVRVQLHRAHRHLRVSLEGSRG